MIKAMGALRITEADLARDLHLVLEQVRRGCEVLVEQDNQAFAVLRPAEPPRRRISECIAMLPVDSTATIDSDFAVDVEAAIASHREALEPPVWD
jgi:hypothetical protein